MKKTSNRIQGEIGSLPFPKKGKSRIHYAISFQTLKAVDLCETFNIDLGWLKAFFLPNGELYEYLEGRYCQEEKIQLPIPSRTDDVWLYKFKETLQRNLVSFSEDYIVKIFDESANQKRKEFYDYIKPHNENLYNYYTDHFDELIAEYNETF